MKVTWTIEVDASSAHEAAMEARRIQLDVDSSATIFEVEDECSGQVSTFDLTDSEMEGQR